MRYWDIIAAADLTGYARAEAELLAESSLARFLPNAYRDSHIVEFVIGETGLVEDAPYRAYDAEPEFGGGEAGEDVVIKLPAASRKEPIGEYAQLRQRGLGGDEAMRRAVIRTMRRTVKAVANTADYMRGIVLTTGSATVNQRNFRMADDFGRDPALTATAAQLWTATTVNRLDSLKAFYDVFDTVEDAAEPGRIVMDRDAWNAFIRGDEFQVSLANGASRMASEDDIRAYALAAGLPPIEVNKERTSRGPVLPSGTVLFLPEPVDPEDEDATELGNTFWGTPLSATEEEYAIEDEDRPGILSIAERATSVPHIAQVTSDSIQLPVLRHANRSGSYKVL